MRRWSARVALATVLALCCISGNGVWAEESAHPALRAIDRAQAGGELTAGQADLYRVMFLTGDEGLPDDYRHDGAEPVRCGTSLLQEIRERAGNYAGDLGDEMDKLLSRPSGLDSSIDTDHFRIHYATSGEHVIYGWPNTAYLDGLVIACEESWEEYHGEANQHWDAVPSDDGAGGGSGLIDCYVVNLGTGLYGYAEWEVPVPGPPNYDYTGFFVIDNDYQGFGYPDRLDPARVTIAHEYHHVVQFGYCVSGGGWWMEQTATMQEDQVYDSINDNYLYLACFYNLPYRKLSWANGCHEYGTFVWPRFLSEAFEGRGVAGEGLALVEAIWAELKWTGPGTYERMDEALLSRGSSLDEAFAEFGRWNFYTEERNDGNHYEEGAGYREVLPDRSFSSYPWFDQHPSSAKRPDRLGTSYMRFNRDTKTDDNTLRVTFRGPETVNAVTLMVKEEGAEVFHEYAMTLDSNQEGSLTVEAWDAMDYAFLSVSIGNMSGDAQDYSFDVETLFGSASVGDEPSRIVIASQNHPNPFYPATTIRYRLAEEARVRVRVVDPAGRIVSTLVDGQQSEGSHEVKWLARDDSGRPLPAGVYFYQVDAGRGTTLSRKMVLLP